MANNGRYALKTLAMDSTSRRRTGAPGLVITAVSANTSAASSTNTASGNAGSAGACTIVAPHDRNVSSYTACSATALATSMGLAGQVGQLALDDRRTYGARHCDQRQRVLGPAGRCSSKYRVSSEKMCSVVPRPSQMQCERFGYAMKSNGLP